MFTSRLYNRQMNGFVEWLIPIKSFRESGLERYSLLQHGASKVTEVASILAERRKAVSERFPWTTADTGLLRLGSLSIGWHLVKRCTELQGRLRNVVHLCAQDEEDNLGEYPYVSAINSRGGKSDCPDWLI